ncbi:MAG: protein kinase [Pseudomonadales bacterium]|nr:protein kinase [Pseudomonadales bacterium]
MQSDKDVKTQASKDTSTDVNANNIDAADDDKTQIQLPPVVDQSLPIEDQSPSIIDPLSSTEIPQPSIADEDKTQISVKSESHSARSTVEPLLDKTSIQGPNTGEENDPNEGNDIDGALSESTVIRQHSDAEIPNLAISDSLSQNQSSLKVIKNRFELISVLGSGGMGCVYKAIDRRKVEAEERNPYVAVKVLNDDFKNHPMAFISLQRETRKSQTLAHPNIVTAYDFDRDGDTVFMTMEFLDGLPLDRVISDKKGVGLDRQEAVSIIQDLGAALIYAHANKIAHSDFKPGNIFLTKSGSAKVFDFGIARAVSNVGGDDDPDDDSHDTKFDAGNLGALTPAYASLEMLEGETPDVRDDIYALGCVAYELFTGQHPFKKKAADKALKEGLKPTRIAQLSRREWKALEQSLAFRREDRTKSVDDFVAAFEKKSSLVWWLGGGTVAASVALATMIFTQPHIDEDVLRQDIRSDVAQEVEVEVKLDILQTSMEKKVNAGLLNLGQLSSEWEGKVGEQFSQYVSLMPEGDPWAQEFVQTIALLYIESAKHHREKGDLEGAYSTLEKADAWSTKLLIQKERGRLSSSTQQERTQLQVLADQRESDHNNELEKIRAAKEEEERTIANLRAKERYNQALGEVNSALACKKAVNFSGLQKKLVTYKKLAGGRYAKQLSRFSTLMASCLKKVAKVNPATADKMKLAAMGVFPNSSEIMKVKIDPCITFRPGAGGKSANYFCRDNLNNDKKGPKLVVVPGISGNKAFAVGKFEVSVIEMNTYCRSSKTCKEVSNNPGNWPAINLGRDQAIGYLAWLSQESGFHYRLPTSKEWTHAAKAKGNKEDPNRNCTIKAKGIFKGKELISTDIGKANSWGLVNHVGNAQEWGTDGKTLLALGGKHSDPFSRCHIKTARTHNGRADTATGFRVVREL